MRTLRDIPEADALALKAAVEIINKYPRFIGPVCGPDCCPHPMGHKVTIHRLVKLLLSHEEIR